MTNLDKFLASYREHLLTERMLYPERYLWPISEFEEVFRRMTAAIKKGTYNKDSKAFRRACREMGIPHTYRAIQNFIGCENDVIKLIETKP